MSRNAYVVAYDIRDPGRLRRTHKVMLGVGDPIQYSVFFCELSRTERMLLEGALRSVVALKEDSVVVVDLGPVTGRARRRIIALGRGQVKRGERATIV